MMESENGKIIKIISEENEIDMFPEGDNKK